MISDTRPISALEPTLRAAQARLDAVRPDLYAKSRNHLDGAVSRLSPYLTHGFLSLARVFGEVNAGHPLVATDKFVFELGWRAYYRHVWSHLGTGIDRSIHPGPLEDAIYAHAMPEDVLQGRTGIPAIDLAVRELYRVGYLHNHARMWLASYLVHLRKIHWRCGAQWMLSHLVDGDVASNTLSWQWVAGTNSTKPYVFNADNVAKFAPPAWHSSGTIIDVSYETLARWVVQASPVADGQRFMQAGACVEPATTICPVDGAWGLPDEASVAGRDIWLIHPWSLGGPPCDLSSDVRRVGVGMVECHQSTPWDRRRWELVTAGMAQHTDRLWWGTVDAIASALRLARSVRWQSDGHVDEQFESLSRRLNDQATLKASAVVAPQLFQTVPVFCSSFSKWWKRTRIIV